MSTLLKNADILIRKNGKIDFLRSAYLGIEGSFIEYVSENAPSKSYDSVKDMSGKLLIPGLVNAHTHTPMTLLRGVGSGLPLQRWLFEAIFPIEDKMVRFSDKEKHQLFLEPESIYYDDIYVQGFSTSMPTWLRSKRMDSYEPSLSVILTHSVAGH